MQLILKIDYLTITILLICENITALPNSCECRLAVYVSLYLVAVKEIIINKPELKKHNRYDDNLLKLLTLTP